MWNSPLNKGKYPLNYFICGAQYGDNPLSQPSNRFGIYADEDEIMDYASEASDSDNGSEHSHRHLAPLGSLLGSQSQSPLFSPLSQSSKGDDRPRSASIHISSDGEGNSPEPQLEPEWKQHSPLESPKRTRISVEEPFHSPVSSTSLLIKGDDNRVDHAAFDRGRVGDQTFFDRPWSAFPRHAPISFPLRAQRETLPIVASTDVDERYRVIQTMQARSNGLVLGDVC